MQLLLGVALLTLSASASSSDPTTSGASSGASSSTSSSTSSGSKASSGTPSAKASGAPTQAANTAPRTTGSAETRAGKTVTFGAQLPEGFSDRTPKALGKYQRAYAASDDFKEGYAIEVSAPNPLIKDAATLVSMAEKQSAKVLRNESADGGHVVALEPKEGAGKLLLLHASVDQGRVYCRGNAAGSVTADQAKAVEFMVNVCKTAKSEP